MLEIKGLDRRPDQNYKTTALPLSYLGDISEKNRKQTRKLPNAMAPVKL